MTPGSATETISGEMRAKLVEAADNAAKLAYCPYSNFRIGAAVVADSEVFSGCNIENASYGLTICAERTAIFKAVSGGHRRITAIALICLDADRDAPPTTRMPCGACCQVLAEFGNRNTLVIVDGVGEMRLSDLLPKPFELKRSFAFNSKAPRFRPAS
jgi:cytidine deaminase